MRITLATPSAGSDDYSLIGHLQIGDQFVSRGVADNRSHGNFDFPVIAPMAVAVTPHTVLTARRFVLLLIAQIKECCELRIGESDNVAAVPTVAAVWPTARHIFRAAKAHTAASAVAGKNAYLDLIDKFHRYTR